MTNKTTENFISPLNNSLTSFGEPEINGYYRNTIINSNLLGKYNINIYSNYL